MGTQRLWVITAEILVEPGDLPSGETKGFANIVTWADSPKTAQQKVSEVLKAYKWEVLGIEATRPFNGSRSYNDDVWTSLIKPERIPMPASLEPFSATSQTSGSSN
jgi:hypothetical protein